MNEVSSIVEVEKIDVDEDYERAQQYGVRNIPTVVLVDGVNEVKDLSEFNHNNTILMQ